MSNRGNDLVRINKYLADSGICSRRAADEHILRGEVMINGKPANPGDRVDGGKDKVLFRGKVVKNQKSKYEYWAVYKPVGYISTSSDEFGRRKVVDLVKSATRLYPVGRLDGESEGLMILTNDGELTKQLTHPSFLHRKTYRVTCRPVKNNSLEWLKSKLINGVDMGGQLMRVEDVLRIEKIDSNGLVEMELSLITGYNRQIRRMCDKIGLEVVELVRTGIANLALSKLNLKPGQIKKIKREDVL